MRRSSSASCLPSTGNKEEFFLLNQQRRSKLPYPWGTAFQEKQISDDDAKALVEIKSGRSANVNPDEEFRRLKRMAMFASSFMPSLPSTRFVLEVVGMLIPPSALLVTGQEEVRR